MVEVIYIHGLVQCVQSRYPMSDERPSYIYTEI